MPKKGLILFSALFLIITVTTVVVLPVPGPSVPVRQISRGAGNFEGALLKDIVLVQELRMTKDYLKGIDLGLGNNTPGNLNRNTLIILDSSGNILYTRSFTSLENDNEWFSFRLKKPVYAGRGKKITLCLAGNGLGSNYLKAYGTLGLTHDSLYAYPLTNENVLEALRNNPPGQLLPGTLILRTLETNHAVDWVGKLLWSGLSLLLALSVIFFREIRNFINRNPLSPPKTFLVAALATGVCFCILNPPFQSPDENEHFFRAYQLTELQLYGWHRTIPASLVRFESRFSKAFFGHYFTTSFSEILRSDTLGNDKEARVERKTKDDIAGYIPQAVAIGIARAFHAPLVVQLLAARLSNLILTVLLITLAIRMIPTGKWLLFLLGMMPMTLLLMTSASYFGLRIGLAFLVLASLLNMAWGDSGKIRLREWAWVCLLVILLGMSQFPYLMVCLLVVLIPFYKYGGRRRFVLLIGSLAISILFASPVWSGDQLFHRFNSDRLLGEPESQAVTISPIPKVPGAVNMLLQNGINNAEQKNHILQDPWKFLSVTVHTIREFGWFYVKSFVGIMGWLTVELPLWLVISFILALAVSVLAIPSPGIRLTLPGRMLMPGIFMLGFLVIEAGLYVTWTPVGAQVIEGVQGRYFIPLAPLLFLTMMRTGRQVAAESPYKTLPGYGYLFLAIVSACTALCAIIMKFYTFDS